MSVKPAWRRGSCLECLYCEAEEEPAQGFFCAVDGHGLGGPRLWRLGCRRFRPLMLALGLTEPLPDGD